MIWNLTAFIISTIIGNIILFYGYYLFSTIEIEESVVSIKPTLKLYIKEYFFYEIFLLLSVFLAFYVEWWLHILIYISIVLTWLLCYIIDIKSLFNKDTSDKVDIWYIKFNNILDKSFIKKEKNWMLFLFMWVFLWAFLYFDPNVNKECYYVWLSAPIITPILYWIAYTDRNKKLILERFLILALLAWVWTFIVFNNYLIENMIALMVFSWFSLFCIGLINQFRKDPVLWYMDFPVAFALWMTMFWYSFIFFWILLWYTWIQGIVNKFGSNDRNFAVWLFWFSHVAYIISLSIIWTISR